MADVLTALARETRAVLLTPDDVGSIIQVESGTASLSAELRGYRISVDTDESPSFFDGSRLRLAQSVTLHLAGLLSTVEVPGTATLRITPPAWPYGPTDDVATVAEIEELIAGPHPARVLIMAEDLDAAVAHLDTITSQAEKAGRAIKVIRAPGGRQHLIYADSGTSVVVASWRSVDRLRGMAPSVVLIPADMQLDGERREALLPSLVTHRASTDRIRRVAF